MNLIAWASLCAFVFSVGWKSIQLFRYNHAVAPVRGAGFRRGRRDGAPAKIDALADAALVIAMAFAAWTASTWLWSLDPASTP